MERQRARGPECIRRGWGGNGWGRFAGRISMRGALFARCPQFLEEPVSGQRFVTSLEALRTAYQSGDHALKCSSWKVFWLTSRMLLWRPPATWTKQSRVGITDGAVQREGLGVAVGGGEVQRRKGRQGSLHS